MFTEAWKCFCCPSMHKPHRRSIVAPLPQVQAPLQQPQQQPQQQLQTVSSMPRMKKRSDLSMSFH